MVKIGIIGAGAAGFFAAIHASGNGNQVLLLEKNNKVLSKVKVSGGGRCNVTHAVGEVSQLIKHYPRGKNFLKKVFSKFSVQDTIQWFESRGASLKEEADGRMFPMTDSSQTIIDTLELEAERSGVKVLKGTPITKIEKKEKGFLLHSPARVYQVDKVIIASGGNPKSVAYDWIRELGHAIVRPVPSLFTFNTPNESIRSLPGITVDNAQVKLEGSNLLYHGPVLVTHWGISGPAVLKLSAFGAEWLFDKNYRAKASIRWVGDKSEEGLKAGILAFKKQHPKKKIFSNPLFYLPARLWQHICVKSEVSDHYLWLGISKKQINKLVENVFHYTIFIEGKTTFKEEFVTAGGVDLAAIDPNDMQSRIVPDLHFAGEVINVDGITGGFNFQAAWSTGFIAGSAAKS